jgi:hypothetical protein
MKATQKKYNRIRFHANCEDWRPVIFPPLGPYWCSGTGDDYSIIVAYVPCTDDWQDELLKYWPEAVNIDLMQESIDIRFSDRFPKPDWFTLN